MRREEVVGLIIIAVFVAGAVEAIVLPHIYTPQPLEFLRKILPSKYWSPEVFELKFKNLMLVKNYHKTVEDLPKVTKLLVKIYAKSCVIYIHEAKEGILYNISAYRSAHIFASGTPELEIAETELSKDAYLIDISAQKGVIVIEVSPELTKELDIEVKSAVAEIKLALPSLSKLSISIHSTTSKIYLSQLINTSILLECSSSTFSAEIAHSNLTLTSLDIEVRSSIGKVGVKIPENTSVQVTAKEVLSSSVRIEVPGRSKTLTMGSTTVGKVTDKGLLVNIKAYSSMLSLAVRQ